jgi:23S rRNA pseudouridine1911/1915/1917 synthase
MFASSKSEIKRFISNRKEIKRAVLAKKEISIPIDLVNRYFIYPEYDGPQIEILFEDEDVLVLNKPPDIHSHPLKYSEKNNCLSFLREKCKYKTLKVNDRSYDKGLLYRLDYGTSGVLFFIKNDNLFKSLRKNFNLLVKEKNYLAIVEGDFDKEGEHKSVFIFKEKKGRKVVIKKNPKEENDSRRGILSVKKLFYNDDENISLVLVKLKTGVRHQIRVQLSSLGFPILGDELYGGSSSKRLFLHAFSYKIPLSKDKEIDVISKNAHLFNNFFNMDRIFKMLKN